jgi:hypothetical protein
MAYPVQGSATEGFPKRSQITLHQWPQVIKQNILESVQSNADSMQFMGMFVGKMHLSNSKKDRSSGGTLQERYLH